MGHEHLGDHRDSQVIQSKLMLVFTLTFLFMIVEVIAGLVSNSLALLADAGHMLSDVLSLGLSIFALLLSQRPRDTRYTFGYNRAEVIAAMVNGMSLILISTLIIKEAIERYENTPEIQGSIMLIAAMIGLLVNIYGMIILRGHTHDNLNVSSAFFHITADLLGSVAAIFASIMIIFTGNFLWDIITSVFITILIIISGLRIIMHAARILMQRVPSHMNTRDIEDQIRQINNVENVHDLHIWAIDQKSTLLTAHIEVSEGLCQHDRQEVMIHISQTLKQKYAIKHSTLQIEHPDPKLDRRECGCD